ncbi:PLP-dependent aminotransferase family protein [Streptomyces tanashiensis]|uniref:PLP-dependent aminotransferase family protein n=1 Tax=Streptomyces tanashiensis TaxID=67367 RepID=A0ABY6QZA8_9ACTN|nr:PLP-dependent aminotransferase family protein [Streptomyces tanashiensis]UZX23027.1 PLP-dependent aminotransferase family protein [Streptomyces tanashiensis]GGY29859.1 GntR family transcriptional regulator [Streptomyces tanashiensis]
MDEYRRIADRVEAAVRDGRLRPGDRLPPQRVFARRHGIANSTAIRVYGELTRRGLVVGEVGRGTFVRAAPPLPGPALAEATGAAPVDLQLNYPAAEGQAELMARALAALARPDVLAEAVSRPAAAGGTPEAREAAAAVLARPGWAPDPDGVLFAGNGRQAIAAALSALVPPGGRLGVEALTYPLVKAVAERLGIRLVALALDAEGVRPDALEAAHRAAPLAAVYLQPTLHNPLSTTTGEARRAELAELLRRLDLTAVEDTTWAFLVPDAPAPLAAHAPERVLLVDSLSKRLAPGLTVGYLVVPARFRTVAADALRSGAWTAGGLALAAATRWTGDGTVAEAVAAKRTDTGARHALLLRRLAGHTLRTSPHAYYCWWELPAPWRAETFTAAAAARAGVAVTPGSAFAVGRGAAPDAIRLGLASPPHAVLDEALTRLAAVAAEGP